MELRKFVVPECICGSGALQHIGRYARNFGARKALVVSDAGVVEAGWAERALASLTEEGVRWELFQDVTPNPKDHEVAAGVEVYREAECDLIVAVGGGSPMDCAKGIGIAFANQADVRTFEGVDEVPTPGPPLICVPTTAGSASDVSQFAIISDTGRHAKIAIISKTMVPDVALIDPETTTTLPAPLIATTGLDALVHAVEAYVSNASSIVTDLNALAAVQLIAANLVPAIEKPREKEVRNNLMLGSLLAGMAFSNASLGLVHAMAHSLGGLLDLPHGLANALLLDHVVDHNYAVAAGRYEQVGKALGVDMDGHPAHRRRDALIKGLGDLREQTGLAASLGPLGVRPDDLPRLAANASRDPCLVTNPCGASPAEIEDLYARAL